MINVTILYQASQINDINTVQTLHVYPKFHLPLFLFYGCTVEPLLSGHQWDTIFCPLQ